MGAHLQRSDEGGSKIKTGDISFWSAEEDAFGWLVVMKLVFFIYIWYWVDVFY